MDNSERTMHMHGAKRLSQIITREKEISMVNRRFATNDHMVHGGGQAHYYSRTGTSKQRQVKLHWFRSLCLNVPVRK